MCQTKVTHCVLLWVGGRAELSYFLDFNDEAEGESKDWVFQNFTFKRFEGLTQRGHVKV